MLFRKFLLLSCSTITCFLFSIILPAQNCNCPDLNPANAKQKSVTSKSCEAGYYEWVAENLISKRSYDSVEFYLQKSATIYKENNCPEESRLNYYKQMTAYYFFKSDFTTSLDYCLKYLPLAENLMNDFEIANAYLQLSVIFNRMKQSDKGIEYARKAVAPTLRLNSSVEKADLLFKITARYYFHYQDYKNQNSLDSTIVFNNHLLQLAREINSNNFIVRAFNRMGGLAFSKKNYAEAITYYDSALNRCKSGKDYSMLAANYGDKGNVLMEMGNYKQARIFADSCLYYNQLVKFPLLIANAYSLINEIESKAGNFKEAYSALVNENKITDSINKVEKTKAINELEKKYNQAKNEKTIKELDQQKRIYLLFSIAGLMALVAIGFFIRQLKFKNKHKILETEQRLNRARMNPHFFFNALTSLQSYVVREDDKKELVNNISKFSHIMRETLESTYKEYVTIEQEIDFLNEYMEVQKLRLPKSFTYIIKADNDLEINELMIPSMIVQPFAENSIEHGFSDLDYEGKLLITFSAVKNELVIDITDNGKGFSAKQKDNGYISRASEIVKERIYLLNLKLKSKARFLLEDNKSGKGIHVQVCLPVLYKDQIKNE